MFSTNLLSDICTVQIFYIHYAGKYAVDSRFPDYGKVVLLSFPRYEGDFLFLPTMTE